MKKLSNLKGLAIVALLFLVVILFNSATNNTFFSVISQVLQISWALIKGFFQVLNVILGFVIKIFGL